MRAQFDPRGLLITAAVSAGEPTILDAYDIPSISRSLHYIFLMTYDFHGGWEDFTHHHAPMERIPQDSGNLTGFNCKHAVNVWLNGGCPREKLVFGMGSYGRGWHYSELDQTGLYAPTSGVISAGPYTRTAGILGYNEVSKPSDSDKLYTHTS